MDVWSFLVIGGMVTVWLIGPHVSFELDDMLVRVGTVMLVSAPFMLVMAAAFLVREWHPSGTSGGMPSQRVAGD